MIYKLIVNAAFLAIGYYVGKQVGLNELVRKESEQPRQSPSQFTGKEPSSQAAKKPKA
jgi:hypothetical protein